MDLPTTIGTVIGTGIATFAATWKVLVTPIKRQLEAPRDPPKALMERIATLESEAKELRRRVDEHAKNVDHLEVRVSRTVTSEEFAAHSSTTAEALRALSEKVGQAKGAIETWLSTIRR
jgi:predicted  nucleic acid-binding Zn-ribbon protein